MGGQIATVGEYRAEGDSGPEVDGTLGGEVEGGEADSTTLDHFAPAGDDSPPLPGDFALAVELDGESETLTAAAYSDETARVAKPGEKRVYARDATGAVVSEAHLQGDGTITITNSAATVTLAPSGAITLSGTSVSLAEGTPLGEFLTALHAGVTAWIPAPTDGGAALKTALTAWLAKAPPAP